MPCDISTPASTNIGTANKGKLSMPPTIDLTTKVALAVKESSTAPGNTDTMPSDTATGMANARKRKKSNMMIIADTFYLLNIEH